MSSVSVCCSLLHYTEIAHCQNIISYICHVLCLSRLTPRVSWLLLPFFLWLLDFVYLTVCFDCNCTLPLVSARSSHPTLCWMWVKLPPLPQHPLNHYIISFHTIILFPPGLPHSFVPLYITCLKKSVQWCHQMRYLHLNWCLVVSVQFIFSSSWRKVFILKAENRWLDIDESWVGHGVHFKPKAAVSPPTHNLKAILKLHESGNACHFPLISGESVGRGLHNLVKATYSLLVSVKYLFPAAGT